VQAASADPAGSGRRRAATPALALVALTALAAIPRLLLARRSPLDADEIYIVFLARHGLEGMLKLVNQDVEQPLFYLMTWAWRGIGGETDLWIRTLSILAGIAGVLVIVPLGRRIFGARVAWLAAVLLALQRTHIIETQAAKPTATLWLLLSLAILCGWSWLEERRARHAVLFVVAGTAALYTYYFVMFPLAILLVSGAIRLRGDRAAMLRWLALGGAMALLFAPLAPTWWNQLLRDVQGDAHVPPMGVDQLEFLARRMTSARLAGMLALFVMMALAFLPRAQRWAAGTLWAMIVIPILVPFAISQAGAHLFFYGQMEFVLPFACLLMAAGVFALPGRLTGAVLAIALVALVAWEGLRSLRPTKDGFAEAVGILQPLVHDGDVVVATEPHALLYFQYHLPRPLRYRLLVMPGVEAFHYSDAVLAIPDSLMLSPERFLREDVGSERWWGLRFLHFPIYRTGKEAAALLDSLTRGPMWRSEHVSIWSGRPLSPSLHRTRPAS
jgi:4-amino-4-deoxy-L-arabinose transferase-like glycosyltransferase